MIWKSKCLQLGQVKQSRCFTKSLGKYNNYKKEINFMICWGHILYENNRRKVKIICIDGC